MGCFDLCYLSLGISATVQANWEEYLIHISGNDFWDRIIAGKGRQKDNFSQSFLVSAHGTSISFFYRISADEVLAVSKGVWQRLREDINMLPLKDIFSS